MAKRPSDDSVPALVHAYLDCPHCGRIPKPTGMLLVSPNPESPDRLHTCMQCDRCGCYEAVLYLEREIMPRH